MWDPARPQDVGESMGKLFALWDRDSGLAGVGRYTRGWRSVSIVSSMETEGHEDGRIT